MKTLLTAVACITLLSACKKDEPVAVATVPVEVPAASTTVAPPASMPPATMESDMAATTATTATTPDVTSTSGSSVAGATQGAGDGMYVVDKGDTLWNIAERNGIAHGDLAKWNNVSDPRELQIGRQLRLTAP